MYSYTAVDRDDPELGGGGFSQQPHHRYTHDTDDKHLKKRRRHGQLLSPALKWAVLVFAVVFGVGMLSLWTGLSSAPPSSLAAASSSSSAAARVLQQQQKQPQPAKDMEIVKTEDRVGEATAPVEQKQDAPATKKAGGDWEERQATGQKVLLAGVDAALHELMAKRGPQPQEASTEAENDTLPPPADFTAALALLSQAETTLAQAYDGTEEIIERDYFKALAVQALLRLHQGEYEEMNRVLAEAKEKMDLDNEENAVVSLLLGYGEEAQGSAKAGSFFELAREYDPAGCHETLLDTSYQPPTYQLSVHMPHETPPSWPALADLLVFRELYALVSSASATAGSVWPPPTHHDNHTDLPYAVHVNWGLDQDGVAQAARILQTEDFVVLRDLLHPFELAVLERHYRAKVASGDLDFDTDLGRAVSYQDRVGHWLNHRLTALLSTFVGHQVKHAYSFLCHYEKRDGVIPSLRPHTDREDNQYTVSIQIYANQERPFWPLFVDRTPLFPERSSWRDQPEPTTCVQCDVGTGDALVFLGRRHTHYRLPMPTELSFVASLLLHFVDASFDFFDYKVVRQRADPSI